MTPKLQTICNIRLSCGEGPVWVPQSQKLYWTDSNGTGIYCYDNHKNQCEVFSTSIHASAMVPHADGGFIIGNKKGFYHINQQGNKQTVSDICDNRPIRNINELIADSKGRIYGGQESFEPNHTYKPGFLYKVDLDRSTTIIEDGLHISNGMGFSLDDSTFYLVDTIPRLIYAYDFNASLGTIANKRVFIKLDKNDGLPDGLSIDAEGYIWIARFLGNGISRYDPDGKIETKIDLPIAQPTSLTFGGEHYTDIFITSASMYWKTQLAPDNHDFKTHRGGELIRFKQNILGKAEYLARI